MGLLIFSLSHSLVLSRKGRGRRGDAYLSKATPKQRARCRHSFVHKGQTSSSSSEKKKPYPQRRVRFPLRTVWANKVVLHVQPGSVWRANVCCKAVQSVVIVVRPRLKQFYPLDRRTTQVLCFGRLTAQLRSQFPRMQPVISVIDDHRLCACIPTGS